jgi:hypothetical protein
MECPRWLKLPYGHDLNDRQEGGRYPDGFEIGILAYLSLPSNRIICAHPPTTDRIVLCD